MHGTLGTVLVQPHIQIRLTDKTDSIYLDQNAV